MSKPKQITQIDPATVEYYRHRVARINMWRKIRSGTLQVLSVTGVIIIAIAALIAFSIAMSGGTAYYSDKATIAERLRTLESACESIPRIQYFNPNTGERECVAWIEVNTNYFSFPIK